MKQRLKKRAELRKEREKAQALEALEAQNQLLKEHEERQREQQEEGQDKVNKRLTISDQNTKSLTQKMRVLLDGDKSLTNQDEGEDGFNEKKEKAMKSLNESISRIVKGQIVPQAQKRVRANAKRERLAREKYEEILGEEPLPSFNLSNLGLPRGVDLPLDDHKLEGEEAMFKPQATMAHEFNPYVKFREEAFANEASERAKKVKERVAAASESLRLKLKEEEYEGIRARELKRELKKEKEKQLESLSEAHAQEKISKYVQDRIGRELLDPSGKDSVKPSQVVVVPDRTLGLGHHLPFEVNDNKLPGKFYFSFYLIFLLNFAISCHIFFSSSSKNYV